jgi:hypothetical protein
MGSILPEGVPCAKGWVPHCLELCSRIERSRDYLQGLKNAIEQLAPTYEGLEQAFDDHLIARVVVGEGAVEKRRKIREHLKANWFGTGSTELFYPQQQVARIYAEGLLKTLEAALAPKVPLPITSWWLPDYPEVKMLTMLNQDGVVLLIQTPRPPATAESKVTPMRNVILGESEAWDGSQRVRDLGADTGDQRESGGAA